MQASMGIALRPIAADAALGPEQPGAVRGLKQAWPLQVSATGRAVSFQNTGFHHCSSMACTMGVAHHSHLAVSCVQQGQGSRSAEECQPVCCCTPGCDAGAAWGCGTCERCYFVASGAKVKLDQGLVICVQISLRQTEPNQRVLCAE